MLLLLLLFFMKKTEKKLSSYTRELYKILTSFSLSSSVHGQPSLGHSMHSDKIFRFVAMSGKIFSLKKKKSRIVL